MLLLRYQPTKMPHKKDKAKNTNAYDILFHWSQQIERQSISE